MRKDVRIKAGTVVQCYSCKKVVGEVRVDISAESRIRPFSLRAYPPNEFHPYNMPRCPYCKSLLVDSHGESLSTEKGWIK